MTLILKVWCVHFADTMQREPLRTSDAEDRASTVSSNSASLGCGFSTSRRMSFSISVLTAFTRRSLASDFEGLSLSVFFSRFDIEVNSCPAADLVNDGNFRFIVNGPYCHSLIGVLD